MASESDKPGSVERTANFRGPLLAASAILLVFFGGLGGWAVMVPLSGAAVAPAYVAPEGFRKTVQHLEGGIVADILVREGSQVAAGDVVVVLDDTRARADFNAARSEFVSVLARSARLAAEQAGSDTPVFADDLVAEGESDPQVRALMDAERKNLLARRKALADQVAMRDGKIAQAGADLASYEGALTSIDRQIELIDEEIATVEDLLRKGLDRKPRLLALQRARADLDGKRNVAVNNADGTRELIVATQAERAALLSSREEEVATDADGDAAVETSTETETETDAETETEADADLASSAIAPPEYEPVPGADLVPAPLPSQSGAMLSVRGLTKRFDDTAAVRGIDLDVPVGSIFGIVGPNGAGKTTTLSMITGLLRPDAGTITVHGADVWADPVAAKRQLGVLPDRLRLFDRLTGSQLLYYSAVLRGLDGAVAKRRVADLAAVFRIEDALGRLVSDYSTGMTKKVALAAAMIHAPRMLVLDEPFESVDPVSAATVTGILRDYVAAGGTVLLSSHSMALVERICDRVAVIVDGDVLAVGSIDEVRGDVSLEERFVQLAGSTAELEGVEWLHTFSD